MSLGARTLVKEAGIKIRSKPAHLPAVENTNRSIIFFITVCTKNRRPVLATMERHQAFLKAWQEADHFLVGRYVIMPDHVHLFCSPATYPPAPLEQWLRFWKSLMARRADSSEQIWQREHWDTQLRDGESYAAKWVYVRENPVRQGLCATAEQWVYQGEMHRLEWHD